MLALVQTRKQMTVDKEPESQVLSINFYLENLCKANFYLRLFVVWYTKQEGRELRNHPKPN